MRGQMYEKGSNSYEMKGKGDAALCNSSAQQSLPRGKLDDEGAGAAQGFCYK